MIQLTIDGVQVFVEEGTTILAAAEKAGVEIPNLCFAKELAPYGACGVFAEYYDTWTWHYFPRAAAPVGTFDWAYQEYEFTVDERGFKAGKRPWFHLMMNKVTGEAWFDDVWLEEVSE